MEKLKAKKAVDDESLRRLQEALKKASKSKKKSADVKMFKKTNPGDSAPKSKTAKAVKVKVEVKAEDASASLWPGTWEKATYSEDRLQNMVKMKKVQVCSLPWQWVE